MAYSLRYRKSRDPKVLDFTPAIFEPTDGNYEYNEVGYKKYRPCYYRVDIFQSKSEVALLSFVTALALASRIWMVDSIDTSVLGEFHTSYGVNQYLNGKFFIDRNPPLATLIYTFAAWCHGYRGQQRMMYTGQPFANFPYIQLRLLSATLGALQAPIAYLTLKLMGHRSLTALVAAALFIFENGAISQHRHMLNTAPFGFFVASSVLMWVNFHNHQNNPYSVRWWAWQTLAGASVGCTMSTSWTGILLLPLFWASSARQMWCLLGDRLNSITSIVKEVTSRIWSTVIVPLGIYLLCFQLHFSMLYRSGDHDLLLSPELRSSINAFKIGSSQTDVAYGSKVYMRHLNSRVGYLHSHEHAWVDGSKQQQVTAYPFQDLNNGWLFQKPDSLWNGSQSIEWVKDKEKVRLEHFSTLRKLHSHDKHAPLSQEAFEVTAYGGIYSQDPNDLWIIEFVGHAAEDATSKERIRVLSTKFRLKHSRGCYLVAKPVKLPEYAKGHFEVACIKNAKYHASTWIVENSIHPQLKMVETDRVIYKNLPLYEKLIEVHELMRNYDKIVPNADTVQAEATLPHQWFLGGVAMQLWNEELGVQIVTTLNPLVKWMGSAVTAIYLVFSVLNSLLSKRGIQWPSFTRSQGSTEWRAFQTLPSKEFYVQSFGFLFAAVGCSTLSAYAIPLHMTLSDSLLGLYFLILSIAVAFEVTTIRLPLVVRLTLGVAVFSASCYSFAKLIPTTYGNAWTRSDCQQSGLTFNCQLYPAEAFVSQAPQETQTVFVDIFGETHTIDYLPGEEEQVSKDIRNMKLDIWRSKTRGTRVKERYLGVQSTPAPKYNQVEHMRTRIYRGMTAKYLAANPNEKVESMMKEENTNMYASERINDRNIDPEQKDIVDEEIPSASVQQSLPENPYTAAAVSSELSHAHDEVDGWPQPITTSLDPNHRESKERDSEETEQLKQVAQDAGQYAQQIATESPVSHASQDDLQQTGEPQHPQASQQAIEIEHVEQTDSVYQHLTLMEQM